MKMHQAIRNPGKRSLPQTDRRHRAPSNESCSINRHPVENLSLIECHHTQAAGRWGGGQGGSILQLPEPVASVFSLSPSLRSRGVAHGRLGWMWEDRGGKGKGGLSPCRLHPALIAIPALRKVVEFCYQVNFLGGYFLSILISTRTPISNRIHKP